MHILKLKYRRFTEKLEAYYQSARKFLDLEDTDQTRQALAPFLGVVTCVGLWYALQILSKILSLAINATATVIAIIQ